MKAKQRESNFKTTLINPGIYTLGTGILNTVTYIATDINGTTSFSTGNDKGNGEIVIEKYDAVNKTITDTFKFNAKKAIDGPSLYFQKGFFYKVSIAN